MRVRADPRGGGRPQSAAGRGAVRASHTSPLANSNAGRIHSVSRSVQKINSKELNWERKAITVRRYRTWPRPTRRRGQVRWCEKIDISSERLQKEYDPRALRPFALRP
ncbi:hypothetical protein EVAR_75182_1 [Eumeta japonica]|uniref:Uncharacterized protein n=1 Tax=Eumeta variegata TaxID=151549 RepID=A0A4C1U0S9_EUMVA|nr:hypothetical protein EVAR_75182_1 [Eumeta japonica]